MQLTSRLILVGAVLICGLALKACSKHQQRRVVELPRPESEAFTAEQAVTKKELILSNVPSPQLTDWDNPYLGFAVHVNADDSFTAYSIDQLAVISIDGFPPGVVGIKCLTLEGIIELESRLPRYGNPTGILITSDLSLGESKTFPDLLDALFVPSIQIFYVSAK
jgi:hypothetical protein